MPYNTKKLFEQAKEIVEGNNMVFFIEDIVSLLPCTKPTFYDHFPVDSDDFNALKDLLGKNKVNQKVKLRRDFDKGNSSAEKIALYKLLATDVERRALSMQQIDVTSKDEKVETTIINFGDIDPRGPGEIAEDNDKN